jgi:di/tricarboxylate transporter
MIKKPFIRHLMGLFLGGLAGLSFCISILPVALEITGAGTQAYLGMILSQYALYSALLWAVGGWSVARAGFMKAGVIIMAAVGVSSGGLLVARGIMPDPRYLLAGCLAGLVYGLVGGLLLGRVLSRPGTED